MRAAMLAHRRNNDPVASLVLGLVQRSFGRVQGGLRRVCRCHVGQTHVDGNGPALAVVFERRALDGAAHALRGQQCAIGFGQQQDSKLLISMRATISPVRAWLRNSADTWRRAWSPASWPHSSLTRLKKSRSYMLRSKLGKKYFAKSFRCSDGIAHSFVGSPDCKAASTSSRPLNTRSRLPRIVAFSIRCLNQPGNAGSRPYLLMRSIMENSLSAGCRTISSHKLDMTANPCFVLNLYVANETPKYAICSFIGSSKNRS